MYPLSFPLEVPLSYPLEVPLNSLLEVPLIRSPPSSPEVLQKQFPALLPLPTSPAPGLLLLPSLSELPLSPPRLLLPPRILPRCHPLRILPRCRPGRLLARSYPDPVPDPSIDLCLNSSPPANDPYRNSASPPAIDQCRHLPEASLHGWWRIVPFSLRPLSGHSHLRILLPSSAQTKTLLFPARTNSASSPIPKRNVPHPVPLAVQLLPVHWLLPFHCFRYTQTAQYSHWGE